MRKSFLFFLLLMAFQQKVNGVMQFDQHNLRNSEFLGKDKSQRRSFVDEDSSDEESTKWNIDLSDMLNFDRHNNNQGSIDRKPLTNEEYSEMLRTGRFEDADSSDEFDINSDYDEDEIDALLEADEELRMHIREYLIRYVNLFLNLLELKDKKDMDGEDEETLDFDFVITSRDLKILQDLSENFEERNVFDQLYLIDSIISKGIRLKEKNSFYQDFMNSFSKAEFTREFFISKTSYFYMFVGIAVTMIMAKNLIGLSYRFIAFVFVNNMILMEGLFNYFRKIKEANIADYVDRMKVGTENDACNPESQSIFGKLYDMFYENKCLNYHKNMQLSRADAIFPLESILNAYAFYFVELPCKVIGSGINAFVVSVNAYLPAVVRQLGQTTTQFCVMGFLLLLFILYFVAPQITFSFLGGRFRLNFGRFFMRQEPGNQNPDQYRRIRGTTRAALNEIETENNDEDDPQEEDLDSFDEELADIEDTPMEIEEIVESSSEDEIEILDDHVITDDECSTPEEKNSSENVVATDGSRSEN